MSAAVGGDVDFLHALELATRQAIDQGRFPNPGGAQQSGGLPSTEVTLKRFKPFAVYGTLQMHRHAGGDHLHVQGPSLGLVTQVGFVQQDHRPGAALPDQGEIALDAPQVEVAIKRDNQKERIHIRSKYLLGRRLARHLTREFALAAQHPVNGGPALRSSCVDEHPIPDGRQRLPGRCLVKKLSRYLGEQLSAFGVDAVEFLRLFGNPRWAVKFSLFRIDLLFKKGTPSEFF